VAAPPEAFDETVVELEAGGRVLGPAAHSWSLTGGFNVVVALDDDVDVDHVVAAYAAQFEDHGFEGEIPESDFEGRSAVAARYTAGGGGEIEAVAGRRVRRATVVRAPVPRRRLGSTTSGFPCVVMVRTDLMR
jgi:hypothetical protein